MTQSAALSSTLFYRKGEAAPSPGGGVGFSTPSLAWEGTARQPERAPIIQMRVPARHKAAASSERPAQTASPAQQTPATSHRSPPRPPPRPPAKADAQGRVRVSARIPEKLYRVIRAQALADECPMADLLGAAVVGHLTGDD